MKSTKILVAMLLATVVAVTGCKKSETTKPGSENIVLKVGNVGHDHQLALYYACLEGDSFKKKYGTYLKPVVDRKIYELIDGDKNLGRIELIKAGGGSKMTKAMEAGSFNVGFGGVAAIAKSIDRGQPFKIICPLQTDGDMLVMNTKKFPGIKNWGEFVAKAKATKKPIVIGYKAATAVAKLVFMNGLREAGITFSEKKGDKVMVRLYNANGKTGLSTAFKTGVIDGFVMNQPMVAVFVNKGTGYVVCELKDIPPVAQNANHPCCAIAATETAIKNDPAAIKALLKLIILATNEINADKTHAAKVASKWTKKPVKVEEMSIPTITYHGEFTNAWKQGFKSWLPMMKNAGALKKKLKDVTPDQFVKDICDTTLCDEAAKELRAKKLIK